MISCLDDQVGRIVAALDKKGLRDNTMILFASDNGGATSGLFAQGAKSKEEREQRRAASSKTRKPRLPMAVARRQGQPVRRRRPCAVFRQLARKVKPAVVNTPVHMVDIMPTLLALAGGKGSPDHPFDGKDIWPVLAESKPSPHDDVLINVEAFRGAIRKGDWKLIKIALLPGKTELFNLATDPGEKTNVADQHPEIVADLESRLLAYAKQQKPSMWIKAQPEFVGEQGKTIFDPDYDIDDGGLPHEKPQIAGP